MQLRVGVFKLNFQNQVKIDLLEVIKQIRESPDDETRASGGDEPIRPRKLEVLPEYCIGDFTKIRQVNRMHLSDLFGNEDVIKFGPKDKRPREFTAFLFDPKSECLFVHEHSYGITHASFGRYFQAASKAHKLQFAPVLKVGAEEWLGRQRRFSRIKIALAGIDNADFLRDQGLGTTRVVDLIDTFKSPTVKIDLSIGSDQETTGGLGEIVETVKALLPFTGRSGKVKQLIVTGTESGEAEEFPVNFITDRLVFHWEIDCDRRSGPEDVDRYRCVREAWTTLEQELRYRFAPSPN